MISSAEWNVLSEAYAFLGNSLLKPISQTAAVGLDPSFWEAFPTFEDEGVARCVEQCTVFARHAMNRIDEGVDMIERVSFEYTKLFVGPPKPAAAPWETMHHCEGSSVCFGEATFQMKGLLREAGLEMSNGNNQYEDHLGIELLYLSEMCRREALAEGCAEEGSSKADELRRFIVGHPLSWIDSLIRDVDEAFPNGYFKGLLGLIRAILQWQSAR